MVAVHIGWLQYFKPWVNMASYHETSTRVFGGQLDWVLFNYPSITRRVLQQRASLDQYPSELLSLTSTFAWFQSLLSGGSERGLSSSTKFMFINRSVRYRDLNSCQFKYHLWSLPSVNCLTDVTEDAWRCNSLKIRFKKWAHFSPLSHSWEKESGGYCYCKYFCLLMS